MITDPPAKKVVEKYRKQLIANCSEEDCEPTVVNDRLVYVLMSFPLHSQSRKCIVKLAEALDSPSLCHLTYKIFERKCNLPLSMIRVG